MSDVYNVPPELLDFHSQLRAFHFAISSGQLSLDGGVEKLAIDGATALIESGVRAYQSISGESDKAAALRVLTRRNKLAWMQMQMAESVDDALRMAIVNTAATVECVYYGKLDDVAKGAFVHVVQAVDAACGDLARGVGVRESHYGLDYLAEEPDINGPSL